MVKDLLAGKTLFIEAKLPLGHNENLPLRNLYSIFNTRGMRLRIHKFDDLDSDMYGGILIWAEPNVHCIICQEKNVA